MNSIIIKNVQIMIFSLLTILISYQSIQSMRANTWYFSALNTLKQPFSIISLTELELADEAIKLALKLEPTQAHYWQLSAYVKMLILSKNNQHHTGSYLHYEQVEQRLQNSLIYRQTWAETWIELAKVVSYHQGPSDQVYNYIQKAKKTGPYNFNVQVGVIQIALTNWKRLPDKLKAQYVRELKLAAKYHYRFYKVFEIADDLNKLPLLCLSLKFGSEFAHVRSSNSYREYCL